MIPTEWIQLGMLVVAALSLVVAVAALVYLIRYAGYTREIAEANFKPAVVVIHTGTITAPPRYSLYKLP